MITLRKADERFHSQIDWLDSWHTFSFADHYDPRHMGFRSLRVINDDVIRKGAGFGSHPHRDMEILTVVLDGALQHKDSTGGGGVIRPGDVQRMSAGTGVMHSEFNASKTDPVHLLQIWLMPDRQGIAPGYEQKAFPLVERKNKLQLLASRDAREGSVLIHQDATLYGTVLDGGKVAHPLGTGRSAWIHAARGELKLNGQPLAAGDGAAVSGETQLVLEGNGEALLFDLA
jgi:quercetin 2,3-dioxygenase